MRRRGEHPDIGTGTEDLLLAARDDDRTHLGVLEAQSLHGVVQLDVDAEVVRIQLQLVARDEAALLVNVHRQRRDRTVEREPPVPVVGRVGPELDERVRLDRQAGHESSSSALWLRLCSTLAFQSVKGS